MKHDEQTTNTSRRRYLQLTGGLAAGATLGLAGCLEDAGTAAATGTLATRVKDQPGDIADFESCVVTIEGIWVKPRSDGDGDDASPTPGASPTPTPNGTVTMGNATPTPEPSPTEQVTGTPDEDEDGAGRRYLAFDEPQEADLVQLQDGESQVIDERELAVGSYQFLQLDVSDVEATLVDGSESVDIDTPGNAPLKFNQSFEIRADERTTFIADFVPIRRGQSGSYLIRPVAEGTRVVYGDEATPAVSPTPSNGSPTPANDSPTPGTGTPNPDDEE